MRRSIAFWLLTALPAAGEIHDVLKSAEIEAQFARTGRSSEAHRRPNYAIVLRADQGRPRESMRPDADEIWQVRSGAAALTLGGKAYQIAAGDFVYVPRRTRVRVDPQGGR